jgi:hypothetical protein
VINMNVMKTVRKMELQTTMDEGEIVAVTNAKNDSVTEYAKYHIEDMGRDLDTDQTTRASLEMGDAAARLVRIPACDGRSAQTTQVRQARESVHVVVIEQTLQ